VKAKGERGHVCKEDGKGRERSWEKERIRRTYGRERRGLKEEEGDKGVRRRGRRDKVERRRVKGDGMRGKGK